MEDKTVRINSNTILITGGTSGIGLELASQLMKLGNTVLITGRDASKLATAKRQLPGIHTFQSDVANPEAIVDLYQNVTTQFPDMNVLINNAGVMRKINLHNAISDLDDITSEVAINLSGSIHMVVQFLNHLKNQKNAAIVNVSSGLAFVPFPISPIYGATKAGIHSFTQSLRIQLKHTAVKVFELAPPLTDTPLSHNFDKADISGGSLMDVKKLVGQAIEGLQKDRLEICPGASNVLKLMSRFAPRFILDQLSKPVDAMLSQS